MAAMSAPRLPKQPPKRPRSGPSRQFNFRLPVHACARLSAIARVRDEPQSDVIIAALDALYDAMPADDQKLTDQLLKRGRPPA